MTKFVQALQKGGVRSPSDPASDPDKLIANNSALNELSLFVH
jgi:hypothetical protein